jgi:hypothetical protein
MACRARTRVREVDFWEAVGTSNHSRYIDERVRDGRVDDENSVITKG